MNAHRKCDTCCGQVAWWLSGDEVLRVTARKDKYGEVEDWICNTCRFDKKNKSEWIIEGPRHIDRHSVISQNHYESLKHLKIDVSNQKKITEKAHRS
jgi:NADH-quinone oxidoreductase subunit G